MPAIKQTLTDVMNAPTRADMTAESGRRRARRRRAIHQQAKQDAAAKAFCPPTDGGWARDAYGRTYWAEFERLRFEAGDYDLL